MDASSRLSVITPVSRPATLALIAASVPAGAEWILVTDGPQEIPAGLREHVLIQGPETRRFGDAQRRTGLSAATREFVYFLDDDNLMLPGLADLVVPHLERERGAGVVFGLLYPHPAGLYIWPPPTRVERSQVDTAMFFGRREAALAVDHGACQPGGGWPDIHAGGWPQLAGQRCADFVFHRAFEEAFGLLRLPAVYGFNNGLPLLEQHEPEAFAALQRGELPSEGLAAILHRHMIQADSPPWWKGRARKDARAATGPAEASLAHELLEIAGSSREGSSVPAQRGHYQALVRRIAAHHPGQAVNVLEIGFNAGLGSLAFLEASPQVHVVAFDLALHPYVLACAEHLRSRFPNRLHVVTGDSRETVPRFCEQSGGRFDLLLIDGGHSEDVCRADVLNARAGAAPRAPVIVDDLMPHKGYGVGVCAAWEQLLREGVLVEPRIWGARPGAAVAEPDAGDAPSGYERRWGVAAYGPRRTGL